MLPFAPRSLMPRTLVFAVLLALGAAATARAQIWTEVGDAPDLPPAQVTTGSGPLLTIQGFLSAPLDVDMYAFQIVTPTPPGAPLVQLQCVVIQGPDAFLFDATGMGIVTNETCSGGLKTLAVPASLLPGLYYVAVANYGMEPFSPGGPMWQTNLPGDRAPDGPGAPGPVVTWGGTPIPNPLNPYTLNLAYAGYAAAATPVRKPSWGTLKAFYR